MKVHFPKIDFNSTFFSIWGLALLLFLTGPSLLFAQATITVNAATTLATIPNAIYGNNAQYYNAANNGTVAAYNTAMQISGCRNIRWPGGSEADIVNWNNVLCPDAYGASTSQFVTFLQTIGGTLQPIVNLSGYWCSGAAGSDTSTQYTHAQAVSLAEAWVTWNLTNTGSAKATYWEIGNEVYGNWEQGGQGSTGSTLTGTVYGQYFADYYKGMKAIDSTIKIGAVASPGSGDYSNWTPNMLAAAKAAGAVPDFLIIHNYPLASGAAADQATDTQILSYPATVATQTSSLNAIVSSSLGSSYVGQVKYFMTEYNCSLGPDAQTNEYVNAMFCSEWILEMAKNGWIGANLWATLNGGTPDYGFVNTTTYSPFPNYYVFPMLSGKFGTNMVTCTSSTTGVNAYAAMNASGNLTLFMVNNSPTATLATTITVSGFTPAASGQAWVMLPQGTSSSGAPQEAPGLQINGTANPAPSAIASVAGVAQATGSTFTVSLKPSEMDLIVIPGSTGSTNTPTRTSTPTKTNTPSSTPTSTATKTNTPANTSTFTQTATSTPTKTSTPTSTATLTPTKTNTPSSTPTPTATKTNTPANTSTFTQTFTSTPSLTPTKTNTPSSTPTPTSTKTNTPANTSTFTQTMTSTPSSTPTKTNTSSDTPTSTSTKTNTPVNTSTSTASRTPTASATNTPANTSTFTQTVTSTTTKTSTPTSTVTSTPTKTNTFSDTPTSTSTKTNTPVNTFTSTASFTSTATSQFTLTHTLSPTPSNTPSFTDSTTATPSLTASGTPTATSQFTLTHTLSPTPSNTPSFTDSTTATPSLTASGTPTATPQFSATSTSTATHSNSPTDTSTFAPTATATPSDTTSVGTFTFTPSRTPTATETHPLPTNTFTVTLTPTPSNTTSIGTFTPSRTPTATSTFTFTSTNTSMATVTQTFTNTPTMTMTPTITVTPTYTVGSTVPVLYPNPVSGPTVIIYVPGVNEKVTVQVFTTAFRMVESEQVQVTPGSSEISLPLTDSGNVPLANGLYYVVVTTSKARTVLKMIILR